VQNEPLSDSLIDRLLQQCDRQPNDGTDKRDEVLLTVELMDWRGRKRVVSNVPANCLQAVGANTARPMVTWQVTGPNNNTVPYIYVHREIMMDNPLLARFCQWLDLSVNCKR
jgi:hypothetical protein